jgi:hypothetical protein
LKDNVRVSVDARLNMFSQYFIVPPALQEEVDDFSADILALGERSLDVSAFEAEFISAGLSDRFNSLLPRLVPKAAAPTPELKEIKRQAMKETNSAKDIGQYAAKSLLDHAKYLFNREARDQMQKKMIENDTFDDFTRLSNLGDDIEILNDYLKK